MVWKEPKFPDAPPFDPENKYADPVALIEHREALVRTKQIEVEKARLLREKIRDCYLNEGVNHFQNCKQYVDAYLDQIKGIGMYRSNSGQFDLNTRT